MSDFDKFDEYKFFAENTNTLSERRQAATQTYLTVNTVIFGVIAFLVRDAQLMNWGLFLATAPLFAVGIAACLIWQRIIIQYKELIGWRYDQLMEIEKDLCTQGSYGFYTKEWQHYFKPQQGKKEFGFSILEKDLPTLIMILYGIGIVFIVFRLL